MTSNNQALWAWMMAEHVVESAKRGPQPSPCDQLMAAIEDAIADARRRRECLIAAGDAGTEEYLRITEQITRWEAAWRSNR